jgi:hypothetical protein
MSATVSIISRRHLLRHTVGALAFFSVPLWLLAQPARATGRPRVVVWKDASCGCCNGWVDHMRHSGFHVAAQDSGNMVAIKKARGVPEALQSCHTAVIDGYVIEGHVPAADIMRLIKERPKAKGLAVSGMPASAPGMDQPGEPYTVILFGAPAGDRTYAQH